MQPVEHFYDNIDAPIHFVLSASDGQWAFAPSGHKRELVENLLVRHPHLDARVTTVEAGHLMHVERPDVVASLILAGS